MKLLNCLRCGDILALRVGKPRTCDCGASSGQYTDRINAEYEGPARILGINNRDLVRARGSLPGGLAPEFRCWVISDHCAPVRKRDKFKRQLSSVWLDALMALDLYTEEDDIGRVYPERFEGDPIAEKHHGGAPFGDDNWGEEP